MNFIIKVNFVIYCGTTLLVMSLEGYRKNNISFRKLMYPITVFYFSFLFLDLISSNCSMFIMLPPLVSV